MKENEGKIQRRTKKQNNKHATFCPMKPVDPFSPGPPRSP